MRLPALRTGPVDHDLPVLAVRGADQKMIAIVFGYACHATTLQLYQWSGDWPGYAQLDIEKAEYWDSPGTAVGRAYAIAKALATGNKDAIGDNVKINP